MTTDARVCDLRTSDDLTLRYYAWGEAGELPPVLLLHGFAVHARSNWEDPGVVAALLGDGRHVLALDARGHGASDRPHDPARYGEERMARDVTELLDVLGVDAVHLVGYSMGAVVALLATAADPRVTRLVSGGVGAGVVEVGGLDRRAIPTELVTAALTAENPANAPAEAAGFRLLADAMGADRQALIAQLSAAFRGPMPLADIRVPSLVLAGSEDPLAVRPAVLADAIAGAELTVLPGDHLTVVRHPRFAPTVAAFLSAPDARG
ncbi:alpha/beta fold hydrolase [Streptomyces sp. NPDC006733]|uniref:alpha/beta fold hydrolase n=1 Tax=Streptomyces sp. NPDC006733 TaxID=3155460 RepID=UPI0033D8C1B8